MLAGGDVLFPTSNAWGRERARHALESGNRGLKDLLGSHPEWLVLLLEELLALDGLPEQYAILVERGEAKQKLSQNRSAAETSPRSCDGAGTGDSQA